MKKRVLTKSLSLAMAITLIASMAIPTFADTWGITFLVGGQSIENGKTYTKDDLPGILEKGKVTLKDNVLTLDNVTINAQEDADGILISNNVDTTIELIGDNEIMAESFVCNAISLFTPNDESVPLSDTPVTFTIQGTGIDESYLSLYGDFAGIGADPILKISNCTVAAIGESDGISSRNLIINNSDVIAYGTYAGVWAQGGNIDIQSGSLAAASDPEDYYSAAIITFEDYGASEDLQGGKILLGSNMEVILGGVITDFDFVSNDIGTFDAQTIAQGTVKTEGYGFVGASKTVVIGKADGETAPTTDANETTPTTDTDGAKNQTDRPSGSILSKLTAITGSDAPKASASTAKIADTGEDTAILLIAAAAVISIGTITFTLRKKAK